MRDVNGFQSGRTSAMDEEREGRWEIRDEKTNVMKPWNHHIRALTTPSKVGAERSENDPSLLLQ